MIEQTIRVSESIKAKPAALLVQISSKFKSSIQIKKGDKHTNAKSIMGVMALGISGGKKITLMIEGEDEQEAANELIDFLAKE